MTITKHQPTTQLAHHQPVHQHQPSPSSVMGSPMSLQLESPTAPTAALTSLDASDGALVTWVAWVGGFGEWLVVALVGVGEWWMNGW